MDDKLTPKHRSWNMSRIKNKDTKIEISVRKYLYHLGFRYLKNYGSLPGTPDIVLKKYHTVIFVNGCFWHRHSGCRYATTPKTRIDFWQKKFDANMQNDKKHIQELENLGWQVIIIWECEINKNFSDTMSKTVSKIIEQKESRNK